MSTTTSLPSPPAAPPSSRTGLPGADGDVGQADCPARCVRRSQARSAVGRHGAVGLWEDHPPQLPCWPGQVGRGSHPSEPRTSQQEVEAEDMLRSPTRHLLPRPDAASDP